MHPRHAGAVLVLLMTVLVWGNPAPLETEPSLALDSSDTSNPAEAAEQGGLLVEVVSPNSDAIDVDRQTAITVTFNRQVQPETVTAESFAVVADGQPVSGNRSASKETIVFTPSARMPLLARVTVTLSTAILAKNGSRLQDPYSWSFRAADGVWSESSVVGPTSFLTWAQFDRSDRCQVLPDGTIYLLWESRQALSETNDLWWSVHRPGVGWDPGTRLTMGRLVSGWSFTREATGHVLVTWLEFGVPWCRLFHPGTGWTPSALMADHALAGMESWKRGFLQFRLHSDGKVLVWWRESHPDPELPQDLIFARMYSPIAGWNDAGLVGQGLVLRSAFDDAGSPHLFWKNSSTDRFLCSGFGPLGWGIEREFGDYDYIDKDLQVVTSPFGGIFLLYIEETGSWPYSTLVAWQFHSSQGWRRTDGLTGDGVPRTMLAIHFDSRGQLVIVVEVNFPGGLAHLLSVCFSLDAGWVSRLNTQGYQGVDTLQFRLLPNQSLQLVFRDQSTHRILEYTDSGEWIHHPSMIIAGSPHLAIIGPHGEVFLSALVGNFATRINYYDHASGWREPEIVPWRWVYSNQPVALIDATGACTIRGHTESGEVLAHFDPLEGWGDPVPMAEYVDHFGCAADSRGNVMVVWRPRPHESLLPLQMTRFIRGIGWQSSRAIEGTENYNYPHLVTVNPDHSLNLLWWKSQMKFASFD